MEDKLNGRRPQWKTISMEDDIKEALQMTSACLASKSCTELGPAQPQLVTILKFHYYYHHHHMSLYNLELFNTISQGRAEQSCQPGVVLLSENYYVSQLFRAIAKL